MTNKFFLLMLAIPVFAFNVALAAPAKKGAQANAPAAQKKKIGEMDITRDQFEEIKKFSARDMEGALDSALGGMFQSGEVTWVPLPSYDRRPRLRSLTKQDLGALNACCVASGRKAFGGLRVSVQAVLPNQRALDTKVDAVKIAHAGKPLKLSFDPRRSMMNSEGTVDLDFDQTGLQDVEAALPKLKGSISVTLKVPTEIKDTIFTPKDIGKTLNGVTFKEMKGTSAVFEGAYAEFSKAVVSAQDETGLSLSEGGSSSYSPDQKEAYDAIMKKSWEEIPPKTIFEPKRFVRAVDFKGKPTRYIVQLVTKTAQKKATIPIQFSADFNKQVFEKSMERRICELDQKKVNALTKMGGTRNEAMSGFGQPVVYVKLPTCDNSLYAKGDIDKLQFFDAANKPIANVERENGFPTADDFTDEARFLPKKDDVQRSEAPFPALKTVIAHARYDIPQMELVKVTRSKPKNGKVSAVFKGKELSVTYPYEEGRFEKPSFGGSLAEVVAFDKFGRALASNSEGGQTTAGMKTVTKAYAVPPDSVEVVLLKPGFVFDKKAKITFPPPPKIEEPKAPPARYEPEQNEEPTEATEPTGGAEPAQ